MGPLQPRPTRLLMRPTAARAETAAAAAGADTWRGTSDRPYAFRIVSAKINGVLPAPDVDNLIVLRQDDDDRDDDGLDDDEQHPDLARG